MKKILKLIQNWRNERLWRKLFLAKYMNGLSAREAESEADYAYKLLTEYEFPSS